MVGRVIISLGNDYLNFKYNFNMHYIAIAIFDSEDKSLKDRVDMINSKADKELNELSSKSIGKNFDEVIDLYKKASKDALGIVALKDLFENKLKKHLDELINKEFDSYVISDIYSVDKLLNYFQNNDFDRFPTAILTPSCEWIKQDWSINDVEETKLSNEWEKKVMAILNKYKKKGIVVSINCDS